MPEEIGVSGLAELRDTMLKRLPEALQGKASQRALSRASRPIVALAKELAPSRPPRGFMGPMQSGEEHLPGLLKRSIYSFRNRQSTKTYESRFIGVRSGRGGAWYWKFIEFGRASIVKASGSLGTPAKGFFGKIVRAVPAKPFLRPAFEALKYRAIDIYQKALSPAIDKVAQQSSRRTIRSFTKRITGF